MPLTVQKLQEVYIQSIYPPVFGIYVCDCPKRNVGVDNYFNLGFFANEDSGKTIPIGNLADWGNILAQSADNPSWVNLYNKQLTTLYVKMDGQFGITKTNRLTTIDNLQTAVSGIPILQSGIPVNMETIKSEGYFGNELYDTWHGFLGLRGDSIVYVGAKCDFGQMPWILLSLGIMDAIKVDGGGSYILHNDTIQKATSGNRRINNVGMWEG